MATVNTDKNLSNLRAGDKVIIHRHFGNPVIEIVERTTATLIITSNHERFSKTNGHKTNSDKYTPVYITVPTPLDIEEIECEKKRLQLIREIELSTWSHLTVEQLEEILQILKNNKQNNNYGQTDIQD